MLQLALEENGVYIKGKIEDIHILESEMTESSLYCYMVVSNKTIVELIITRCYC